MRPPGLLRALWLLLALPLLLVVPAGPAVAAERCERWSVEGLRLGMTVAEVEILHPGLRRSPSPDPGGLGPARYSWPAGDGTGRRNQVVADGEGRSARVVFISVGMEDAAPDAGALRALLVGRWGEPSAPEGVERYLVQDKWEDPACDAEAQLRLVPVAPGEGPPARVVVLRSRRAQARLQEIKDRERPGKGWPPPR